MATYSASKLGAYRDCPLKYKFSAIDKIHKPDTIEQFVGTVVHETLQEVVDVKRRFGKELGFDEAAAIFERQWAKGWKDDIVIKREYMTPDDYKPVGLEYVKKFFNIEARRDSWEVMDLEKNIWFQLGKSNMNGYIDRLERNGNSFRIIDYKTGERAKSQDYADADWQLGIYELAVRDAFPEAEDVDLEWYFLGPGEVVASTRTKEAREELEREIAALIAEIESDTEFLPLGNNWCPCEYAEECEAEKKRRWLKSEEVEPEPEDVVECYAQLEERKKQLNAGLKAVESDIKELKLRLGTDCKERGAWSIEGREHVLEVLGELKYSVPGKGTEDRAALDAFVREAGLWGDLSDLNRTEAVKALEKGRFGEQTEAAKCLFEEKEVFKFRLKKK